MSRAFTFLILFSTILTLTSCVPEKPIFQEKVEFDYLGWNRFKELKFTPEVVDASVPYTFMLKVRYTDEYFYNYLEIQLKKESMDGESYVKLFSLPVKSRNQEFLEPEVEGVYEIQTVLSSQIYFSSPGTYYITIEQLMPKFDARGVQSVELIIQKSKK